MRNHFHLAVQTPEPNLSLGMKWLQGTWAVRFNRRRGEVGQPFQGRYKAVHVEPGESMLRVIDCIHLNPVRAGIVAVERLGDFHWSSLAAAPASPDVARARHAPARKRWLGGSTQANDVGVRPLARGATAIGRGHQRELVAAPVSAQRRD